MYLVVMWLVRCFPRSSLRIGCLKFKGKRSQCHQAGASDSLHTDSGSGPVVAPRRYVKY